MFRITRGTGFHIQFENHWTLSVQYGNGLYADNHLTFNKPEPTESVTADVAFWNERTYDGNIVNRYEYTNANEVAQIIAFVVTLPDKSQAEVEQVISEFEVKFWNTKK